MIPRKDGFQNKAYAWIICQRQSRTRCENINIRQVELSFAEFWHSHGNTRDTFAEAQEFWRHFFRWDPPAMQHVVALLLSRLGQSIYSLLSLFFRQFFRLCEPPYNFCARACRVHLDPLSLSRRFWFLARRLFAYGWVQGPAVAKDYSSTFYWKRVLMILRTGVGLFSASDGCIVSSWITSYRSASSGIIPLLSLAPPTRTTLYCFFVSTASRTKGKACPPAAQAASIFLKQIAMQFLVFGHANAEESLRKTSISRTRLTSHLFG